jgi:CheY-like chemotaxis protein
VLLASDDDELRGELSKAMQRDGHHVVELEDGSELLDYLDGAFGALPRPDAIIASLTMAGLGGLELLEALRRLDDRTPFIGLAGAHEAGDFERMRALGAEYLYEGPLRVDDIREALHSLPGGTFPEGKCSHDARLEACERGMRFLSADGEADATNDGEEAQHEGERAMNALALEVPRAQKTLISDALRRAFDKLAEPRTTLEALTAMP